MTNKNYYSLNKIRVRGLLSAQNGHFWFFFEPLAESGFYCPGVEMIKLEDDAFIKALRVSVNNNKNKVLCSENIPACYLHEWVKECNGNASLPFGLKKNELVVVVLLPSVTGNYYLVDDANQIMLKP